MRALEDDREAISRHTAALLATAEGLGTEDLAEASLCAGWTRGHVLAHVARNAEAIGNLVEWATTGRRVEMYPGGTQGRDADIEAGAGRPIEAHLGDLRDTSARLAEQLPALSRPVVDTVEVRGGMKVGVGALAFMRLREVVFHHADLQAGFGFENVEGDLLVAFVEDAIGRLRPSTSAPSLKVRTDEGESYAIGDGDFYVTGSRAGVLLWLSRRIATGVTGEVPELPRGA